MTLNDTRSSDIECEANPMWHLCEQKLTVKFQVIRMWNRSYMTPSDTEKYCDTKRHMWAPNDTKKWQEYQTDPKLILSDTDDSQRPAVDTPHPPYRWPQQVWLIDTVVKSVKCRTLVVIPYSYLLSFFCALHLFIHLLFLVLYSCIFTPLFIFVNRIDLFIHQPFCLFIYSYS